MKPVIIGMNNPYGADPRFALYPLPVGSAGGRLYGMLQEATGIGRQAYLETFERVNLVDGPWKAAAARERAAQLRPWLIGRHVILLGRAVQAAFGIDADPLAEVVRTISVIPRFETVYHAVPHPSGRNLWYNNPANREAAKALLARVHDDYSSMKKMEMAV